MSKNKLFFELAPLDEEFKTRWVKTDEFIGKYQTLRFGNGGSWIRKTSSLNKQFNIEIKRVGRRISEIRLNGKKKEEDLFNNNRPIGREIKTQLKHQVCASCGTRTNTLIDHKNGRYNNPVVLKTKTQKVGDFQVLCVHCNLRKRQVCKECRNTGQRYEATKIYYPKDFTQGSQEHNGLADGCRGCYWYDIEDFRKTIV